MNIVTDSNFDEILSSHGVCVFDFSATWCGPCKKIVPILEDLAKEYEAKVFIGKIDVDNCPNMTEKFGIRSVPTILFFKNGEEVQADRVIGAIDKTSLDNKIKGLF